MIPDESEPRRALIGEYVLGLLDEPEASEVRDLIANDREAARMALEWEKHLLDLADSLPHNPRHPICGNAYPRAWAGHPRLTRQNRRAWRAGGRASACGA